MQNVGSKQNYYFLNSEIFRSAENGLPPLLGAMDVSLFYFSFVFLILFSLNSWYVWIVIAVSKLFVLLF